jgi:diadenosine tetraphosphate (Ap4A) HIT family hydrolase
MSNFIVNQNLVESSILIKKLDFSLLFLKNNKNYPWVILVPEKAYVSEILDLSEEEFHKLNKEIYYISSVLKKIYKPDKINLASIGNIVPQLHFHIVARYKEDNCWPLNVWNDRESNPYTQEEIINVRKLILNNLT